MRILLRIRPGGRTQWLARLGAFGLLALLLAWAAGFGWFIRAVEQVPPPPPPADGIVALTGGADRVQAALKLLAAGGADRLLVSGIGGGADLHDLARRAGIDPRPLADRVTLGRGAASTRGNAEETAAWVHRNHVHSLIVVTAFYHMPRALTEIARAVPAVTLYAAPVLPPRMRGAHWLTGWSGLRLLIGEYTKYLAARLGLTLLEPGPGPLLAAATTDQHQ